MTKAEMETVIRWDREELLVHIWTADKIVMRKLDRLGVPVKETTTHKGEMTGRFYVPIPLERLSWRILRPRTAAQVAAAREAGLRLQNSKKLLGPGAATGLP